METIARHELAAVLLRSDQHHDDEAAAPRAMANLAERGVWYLHQYFREPAQVGDVATALGCHPHALMNAFKHHQSCSVLHYQTQLRLAEAARLLVTSGQAINQIWLAVGFGSASRFYACFRDHFGLPPAHYRRQNRRS